LLILTFKELYVTVGLATGFARGKLSLNLSDRPQFNVALIPTNLSNPSIEECSLFFMIVIACLNKR